MTKSLLAALLLLSQPAVAQRDRPEDIILLRRLLVAHEFARLDSSLAERRLEARSAAVNEIRYAYAYDAFNTEDSTLRVHLDAWVVSQPTSPRARLSRGNYFAAVAGAARGGAFAIDTEKHRFEAMGQALELATADATAAARLDSTDVAAHAIMLYVMRLAGEREGEEAVFRQAIAREPTTLTLRIQHMEALRPRWFGSKAQMDSFAAASQRYIVQNPRLRVLLGFSALERGEELQGDDQFQAAIVAYTKALSYGDFWRYRLARGRLYMQMDQPEKALVDLNRAAGERPGSEEVLGWRAYAYVSLADLRQGASRDDMLRRAREDLLRANALDSTAYIVAWVGENHPELLRPTGAPSDRKR